MDFPGRNRGPDCCSHKRAWNAGFRGPHEPPSEPSWAEFRVGDRWQKSPRGAEGDLQHGSTDLHSRETSAASLWDCWILSWLPPDDGSGRGRRDPLQRIRGDSLRDLLVHQSGPNPEHPPLGHPNNQGSWADQCFAKRSSQNTAKFRQ